jgi:hypothetical protein
MTIDTVDLVSPPKQSGLIITGPTLVLIAFATVFFPRVLNALKVPSSINFLHFIIVPIVFIFILSKTRTTIRANICKEILFGLLILLSLTFASALLNTSGFINAVLDFILIAEPFMMLVAVICLPLNKVKAEKFQWWVLAFAATNLVFAYFQAFVQKNYFIGGARLDNIKGVFINQGAGHVVGASVTLTAAVYFFIACKKQPLWIRMAVMLAALVHVVVSDTKQVLLVFAASWIVMQMVRLKNLDKTIKYLTISSVFLACFIWATSTFKFLEAYRYWMDQAYLFAPDGEATQLKLATFKIVPSYFHSSLNWLLGLGPGHTVSRLGGWLLQDYWSLLEPLGATKSPASDAVWGAVGSSWLGDKSSLFSPLFGWAGIWGDLGILGLLSYLYLWFLVWTKLCIDDLSRFLVLTVFIFGVIFSQLEEPGYMLFVITGIGLRWQRHQIFQENQSFVSKSDWQIS